MTQSLLFSIFLIFSGGAFVATLALYARQALVVAYVALGALIGPFGIGWIHDVTLVSEISQVGIIFLLFLLGMNLEPADLMPMFREALRVTGLSSLAFVLAGCAIAWAFGFTPIEIAVIGVAMGFSSTIIALKLLPTSALHHQRMGEIIVSILLLQDILAIITLLVLRASGKVDAGPEAALPLLALPIFAWAAWWFARHVIHRLIAQFDSIQEYLFLLTIGWCLFLAELATLIGLSHEIGAFIAGVALATSPVARFLSESLKPLRDFFLIIFFVTLGAAFDMSLLGQVWAPALCLAAFSIMVKPKVFNWLLSYEHERRSTALEIGQRMAQISEFSLLIALVAAEALLISERASATIQAASIVSFVISSYWIVKYLPTPISPNPALRRD